MAFVFGNLGLLALGRHRLVQNIYAAVTVLHLLYVVPLVMLMGARGTVISIILTEVFGALAFFICYRREAAARATARSVDPVAPIPAPFERAT
ncbi:hypothetical protein D3C72_1346370 [compost metagenome]